MYPRFPGSKLLKTYQPIHHFARLQSTGKGSSALQFQRSRFDTFDSLYYQDLVGHFGCVNAVEFSSIDGSLIASGGDDQRLLLWDVSKATLNPKYNPVKLVANHLSNVFCLAFNKSDTRLVSAGNDGQVILHDLITKQLIDVFLCENSVYGISVNSCNENLIATACEDGTVQTIDTRSQMSSGVCITRSSHAYQSVMFNPVCHDLIVTANSHDGIALWDIRIPHKELLHYGGQASTTQRGMSARFNEHGNQIICLRRRLPLTLYNVKDAKCVAEFSSPGYTNSCTMKSCCFAGYKDEYIMSGSDDFGVYIWKVPDVSTESKQRVTKATKILRGHNSIVNQVRFNASTNTLISSGVEKIVKVWSTEPLPFGKGGLQVGSTYKPREKYSHNQYLQYLIYGVEGLTHNYEAENTEEDPRMLAFFDSLIQHEQNVTESDSSNSDSDIDVPSTRGNFSELERNQDSDSGTESDGPASLESLGITRRNDARDESRDAKKKIRNLRAQISKDDTQWTLKDCSSRETKINEQDSPCTSNVKRKQLSVDEEDTSTSPEVKRLKEDSSDTNSNCDGDVTSASRTRQRNAKRRRKPFRCKASSRNEESED